MNLEPEHLEGAPSEPSHEPFSEPSPNLDRLMDGVRSLEQWYAVDFERRVAGLTEMLRIQITQELRTQFLSELNAHIERTQNEYDQRLAAKSREWDSQRESLENEIAELRRKLPTNDVMGEIAATEANISVSTDRELDLLIPDAATLSKLLQTRIEDLETQAYLKGLKYRLPENL
ncbi:MAG TPA: hypothetical protein VMT78_13930 [Terriglobia bacterium]|nr:hypothetical protein [Terriglobia bacterium]